jgi:membrane-bound lytic murein transglycosylase B
VCEAITLVRKTSRTENNKYQRLCGAFLQEYNDAIYSVEAQYGQQGQVIHRVWGQET